MKHPRQILLGSFLVLAVSIPALAGETLCPPGEIGTPGITGELSSPGIRGSQDSPGVTGEITTPGLTGEILTPGITWILAAVF